MTVKKGDTVLVVTGKDKGKTGKVLEVFSKDNKVLVDGINIVTKHKKAKSQQEKSEIVKKSAPVEVSNVMVVCSTCGKATRVAHKEISGKNARVCKKCTASLDREFVRSTKKEAKKNIAKTEEAAKAVVKTAPKAEKTVPATKPATKVATKALTSAKPSGAATKQKSIRRNATNG